MYADDTTLSVSGATAHEVEQKLTLGLNEVMTWITKNRLVLNSDKTFLVLVLLNTAQTLPVGCYTAQSV